MVKMGRPPKVIDKELFEDLCGILCTKDEIASCCKCSTDTIERWCKNEYGETFAEAYKKLSANGKSSLRRYQFKLAQTNAGMAIWLGKQYLGQRDTPAIDEDDARNIFEKLAQALSAKDEPKQ